MKLSEPETLQVCESDELLDFDVDGRTGHVVGAGRNGVYDCVGSNVKLVTTSEKLREALRNAKEYLPRDSLSKNVAFNNMEAYKQRKEERLGKKRKLSSCSNGSAPS
ncbi:hypothetical protein AAVH_32964 [Aphelenchoides avenae]|nr:hypothetical protein AAVH_32964 [Aphelenchus avenae]